MSFACSWAAFDPYFVVSPSYLVKQQKLAAHAHRHGQKFLNQLIHRGLLNSSRISSVEALRTRRSSAASKCSCRIGWFLVPSADRSHVDPAMFEKLEFINALARERHFGRAAERCGVAQPTFSQGIQQLEEMLNVPLVKRSSRFLGFTPEGERVLAWARRLVGNVQATRHEIQEMQNGLGPNVRIAAMPSAMPIIASLTAPFQIRNPTVRFTLITRTADEIIKLLHEREIDA